MLDFKEVAKQQGQDDRKRERQINFRSLSATSNTHLQAYERYVMAQFKFQDKSDIEKERAKAIETLIPGTIHYFHLYFLNLVKTKRTRKEWTKEQKDLWL